MIIITPENFNYFGIIPKKFNYFSLNPEINYLHNLEKIKFRSYLTVSDLNNLISFQERLYSANFPDKILPKSLKYNLNFKFTQRLFLESLKKGINEKSKKEVVYISEFKKHKSIQLYLIYVFSKIKFKLNLKPILLIPNTFLSILKLLIKGEFNLFVTNKNQLKNIVDNLKINGINILNSNNIFEKNFFSLDSFFIVFTILTLPLNIIELIYLGFRERKLFKDFNVKTKSVFFSVVKYNFSKFLCKIFKFNLITISNYGISEALNLNCKNHINILINHGVYYYDINNIANKFWKFHSLTMIQSLNSRIISNNIKDFEFIKNNNLNLDYSFKKNTLREKRKRIIPKNKKIILIADTFKPQNTLRPLLYNNAFEYLTFINDICNSAPKDFKIILRHRPNTIISENFILDKNKRLKPSKNIDIYKDFMKDPIVISFTSTVLFESSQLGLRSISYDPCDRNIEFLNFPLYDKKTSVTNRFNLNVKGEINLKHLLCKL